MSKKTFTTQQLSTLSADVIIDKIQHENYSLLNSLGADKLRKEMIPIGQACHIILNMFYGGRDYRTLNQLGLQKVRQNIVKVLKFVAPADYDYEAFAKNSQNGLVIGFNHPSLGEILRLVGLKVEIFGKKDMLFPVNLPWYEALAKDYDRLKKIGIIITPTITPSTWDKMALDPNAALYKPAQALKTAFRHIYTDLSIKTIKNGGVIFVAPSATRQATVFKNKQCFDKTEEIIPTMSMLALKLYSDKAMNCDFLGVAVLPPENGNRGLNLKKKYQLLPAEPMTAEYIKGTYFKTHKSPKKLEGFDYDFLYRIAEKLPQKFWY